MCTREVWCVSRHVNAQVSKLFSLSVSLSLSLSLSFFIFLLFAAVCVWWRQPCRDKRWGAVWMLVRQVGRIMESILLSVTYLPLGSLSGPSTDHQRERERGRESERERDRERYRGGSREATETHSDREEKEKRRLAMRWLSLFLFHSQDDVDLGFVRLFFHADLACSFFFYLKLFHHWFQSCLCMCALLWLYIYMHVYMFIYIYIYL